MTLGQQVIDYIATNRKAPAADILIKVVGMCIADRDSQCSDKPDEANKWVPFGDGMIRVGAKVRLRDGRVGRIYSIATEPRNALNVDLDGKILTHTFRGEWLGPNTEKDPRDIVEIEAESAD